MRLRPGRLPFEGIAEASLRATWIKRRPASPGVERGNDVILGFDGRGFVPLVISRPGGTKPPSLV